MPDAPAPATGRGEGTAGPRTGRRDRVSAGPAAGGEAGERKRAMEEGATARCRRSVEGGRVTFALHGHDGADSVTVATGRRVAGAEGGALAPMAVAHGRFFRSRDDAP